MSQRRHVRQGNSEKQPNTRPTMAETASVSASAGFKRERESRPKITEKNPETGVRSRVAIGGIHSGWDVMRGRDDLPQPRDGRANLFFYLSLAGTWSPGENAEGRSQEVKNLKQRREANRNRSIIPRLLGSALYSLPASLLLSSLLPTLHKFLVLQIHTFRLPLTRRRLACDGWRSRSLPFHLR